MRAAPTTLASALALVAACSVQPRDGHFSCGDGRCPAGFTCESDQRCHARPCRRRRGARDASVDAAQLDAALDAAQLDAAQLDAAQLDATQLDAGLRDAAPPLDAGTDAGPTSTCTVPDGTACTTTAGVCCGGVCRDTTRDPAHCGTCGHGCADAVACTIDYCSGGSCMHEADDSACPEPGPAPMAGDCLDGTGACDPGTGCHFPRLSDGVMCRGTGARYLCGCGQMCIDLNSTCGTTPRVCCSTLSSCQQQACLDGGQDCDRGC